MARRSNKEAAASTEMGVTYPMMTRGAMSHGVSDRLSFIPSLEGKPLLYEMERMWLTDETVGAMGFCIQSTLGQASWSHVPHVDGRPDESGNEDAKWAAEFCNSMLEDMENTFEDHVEEAITMIPFGFAPCEIITKQRRYSKDSRFNDGYWGIEKLPLRDQFSVWQWIYQNDKPVAFSQMGSKSSTVPLWKTLHYRTSNYMNDPNGRFYLGNVHRAYALKTKIQDSEAIGIERDLCGLPTFRIPQEILDGANQTNVDGTPTDYAKECQSMIQGAIKAVSDLRFNRSGGLIIPSDTFAEDNQGDRTPKWDFKLITTAGQRSIDTRTAIRDYDRAIARVLMMQFLHLGDRSTGSFALSSDQSDIGVRSMTMFAQRIAGEWNKKLIPLIWAVNGFDPRYMPKLRADQLNKDGIVQLGKFLADAARGAPLWETDPVVRRALLRAGNLPFDDAEQVAASQLAVKRRESEAEGQQQTLPFGDDPGGDTGDQP